MLGWGEEGKPSKNHLKKENKILKAPSEAAYSGYLRSTLRWLSIWMQLFCEVFGVADVEKGNKNFHSRRTSHCSAQDSKTQTLNKSFTQIKHIRPHTPKKPSSGSFSDSQPGFYRTISGYHMVWYSYSEVVTNVAMTHNANTFSLIKILRWQALEIVSSCSGFYFLTRQQQTVTLVHWHFVCIPNYHPYLEKTV